MINEALFEEKAEGSKLKPPIVPMLGTASPPRREVDLRLDDGRQGLVNDLGVGANIDSFDPDSGRGALGILGHR